ncbi:hypothetical protein BJY04DRAFT_179666 [Aspergillus karnatakaensis]|uniref:ankyrin repeat domain-containing protein n=1 Tax=Aspergillus karnatakaensis TaxID=1810916 RepID=UPI003CCE4C9F
MVDIAVRNADIPMLGALFAHLQVSYPSVAKAHEDRALAYAAEIGCLEVVKALYKRMLAAQAQGHRFTQKDPLYAAIEHGHHEVVKWLLQEGADLCGDTGAWDNALQALCDGVTDSPSASAAVLKVLAMMDTLLGACADIADGANRVYVTQLVQMKRFILANIL